MLTQTRIAALVLALFVLPAQAWSAPNTDVLGPRHGLIVTVDLPAVTLACNTKGDLMAVLDAKGGEAAKTILASKRSNKLCTWLIGNVPVAELVKTKEGPGGGPAGCISRVVTFSRAKSGPIWLYVSIPVPILPHHLKCPE